MANENYTTKVWKDLHLSLREDILPVAEGIKKGGQLEMRKCKDQIKAQRKLLENWLKSSRMKYRPFKSDYYICNDESLLDRFWEHKISIDDFLGYPECCVKNHRESTKPVVRYNLGQIPVSEVPLPQGVILGREIEDAIAKGKFDDSIYFTLHMPCSAYCQASIAFGNKIRECLKNNDLEVAKYLKQRSETSLKAFGKKWTEDIWHKYLESR